MASRLTCCVCIICIALSLSSCWAQEAAKDAIPTVKEQQKGTEKEVQSSQAPGKASADAPGANQEPAQLPASNSTTNGTAQGASNSTAQEQPSARVSKIFDDPSKLPFNATDLARLHNLGRSALLGNESARNVTRGLHYLTTLARLVNLIVPDRNQVRQRLPVDQLQPQQPQPAVPAPAAKPRKPGVPFIPAPVIRQPPAQRPLPALPAPARRQLHEQPPQLPKPELPLPAPKPVPLQPQQPLQQAAQKAAAQPVIPAAANAHTGQQAAQTAAPQPVIPAAAGSHTEQQAAEQPDPKPVIPAAANTHTEQQVAGHRERKPAIPAAANAHTEHQAPEQPDRKPTIPAAAQVHTEPQAPGHADPKPSIPAAASAHTDQQAAEQTEPRPPIPAAAHPRTDQQAPEQPGPRPVIPATVGRQPRIARPAIPIPASDSSQPQPHIPKPRLVKTNPLNPPVITKGVNREFIRQLSREQLSKVGAGESDALQPGPELVLTDARPADGVAQPAAAVPAAKPADAGVEQPQGAAAVPGGALAAVADAGAAVAVDAAGTAAAAQEAAAAAPAEAAAAAGEPPAPAALTAAAQPAAAAAASPAEPAAAAAAVPAGDVPAPASAAAAAADVPPAASAPVFAAGEAAAAPAAAQAAGSHPAPVAALTSSDTGSGQVQAAAAANATARAAINGSANDTAAITGTVALNGTVNDTAAAVNGTVALNGTLAAMNGTVNGTAAAANGTVNGTVNGTQQQLPPVPVDLWGRAMKWHESGLRPAAQAGFTVAALRGFGVMPRTLGRTASGAIVPELHRLVLAGSTEAAMALADRFFSGVGVEQDCTTGAYYAKLAATQVANEVEKDGRFAAPIAAADLREQHMSGWYVSPGDAENADHVVHMDEDMAIRGNADAQRRMAYRRLMGRGIEADPEGAFHDFAHGAAQGDPYAIYNLGFMYLKGLFVKQNYTEAKRLFTQAAEKGFAPGWNGLGVMYWHGQGLPVNYTAAVEMFKKGAAANQSDSLFNLAALHVTGEHVEKNETLAADMFLRAHAEGHWRAAFQLALMYEEGVGFNQSCVMAEKYYRIFLSERTTWSKALTEAHKAQVAGDEFGALLQYLELAEQGSAAAQANAAWLLRHGKGYTGPGYLDLASQLYERAAYQNHTTAMIELGQLLLDADGLNLGYTSDASVALGWWERAATHNSSEALFLLGWAHLRGVGTANSTANRTLARQMFTRSVTVAGRARDRSLAANIALFSMSLDDLLAPLVGHNNATGSIINWLAERLVTVKYVRPSGGVAGGVAGGMVGGGDAEGVGVWREEVRRRVVEVAARVRAACAAAWRRVDSVASAENLVMTCLIGGLVAVLLVRRQQVARHRQSVQRMQGMVSAVAAQPASSSNAAGPAERAAAAAASRRAPYASASALRRRAADPRVTATATVTLAASGHDTSATSTSTQSPHQAEPHTQSTGSKMHEKKAQEHGNGLVCDCSDGEGAQQAQHAAGSSSAGTAGVSTHSSDDSRSSSMTHTATNGHHQEGSSSAKDIAPTPPRSEQAS